MCRLAGFHSLLIAVSFSRRRIDVETFPIFPNFDPNLFGSAALGGAVGAEHDQRRCQWSSTLCKRRSSAWYHGKPEEPRQGIHHDDKDKFARLLPVPTAGTGNVFSHDFRPQL